MSEEQHIEPETTTQVDAAQPVDHLESPSDAADATHTGESAPPASLPARKRRLILIHGHGRKPLAGELENLWRSALRQGLTRDYGRKFARLRDAQVSFVYYGDLTQDIRQRPMRLDEELDLADRYAGLAELSRRDAKKLFRSHHYFRLKGRSALGRIALDVLAPLARTVGADEALIARYSPELARYRADPEFAESLRARLREELEPALAAGEDVILVAHCLGSVIAYDVLWEICQEKPSGRKLSCLVTLGSPLAADAVRRGLCGAEESFERRYPTNIAAWFNVAAQDDYVCYDQTVENDFAPMLQRRLISRIEDIGIFNFARRYGRSNPHNDVGYLVHPKTVAVLAQWYDR